jgi:hypothetical protein
LAHVVAKYDVSRRAAGESNQDCGESSTLMQIGIAVVMQKETYAPPPN